MLVTCPACKKTSNSKIDLTGKSVKCSCGESFTVPRTAKAPAPNNPYHAMSEDDWADLAPKPPPAPDPFAAPKKESATTALLNQARADLSVNKHKRVRRPGERSFFSPVGWFQFGVRILKAPFMIFRSKPRKWTPKP